MARYCPHLGASVEKSGDFRPFGVRIGRERAQTRQGGKIYVIAKLKRGLLLISSAAILTGMAGAQTYDAYGQPQVASPPATTMRPRATLRVAPPARPLRHTRHRVVVVRKRPFSHSLAIVGGSALTGAGVGALIGGPPGAIAGALTGGVGGLIYDRKTHKKRIIVER